EIESKEEKGRVGAEQRFLCTTCGKRFSFTSYLVNHLTHHRRIHTGEKPYKCQDCGKSFTERGNLLCHRRIHTKEKPYACSHCGKTFQRRAHLSKHQEKYHNGESTEGA
uniref:C2H2-type domain-containing protein n=1 Tax=Athene cunicularia TaxID=194338 RepID=A0A663NFP2_ATHCN